MSSSSVFTDVFFYPPHLYIYIVYQTVYNTLHKKVKIYPDFADFAEKNHDSEF